MFFLHFRHLSDGLIHSTKISKLKNPALPALQTSKNKEPKDQSYSTLTWFQDFNNAHIDIFRIII